ncbi:MAG: FHA domain-containing protein [Dehalococcoidia bacterium]|nr:MAG: FHA domain-containing protein [Dehalococcoidia bacterium]
MSYLIARSDSGQDISVSLTEPVEIGRGDKDYTVVVRARSETTSLGIADATVSKKHALIYTEVGKLMLKDVGSTNGTMLNNTHLPGWKGGVESQPVEIVENSNVRFGYNTLVRITLGERTLTPQEWKRIQENPS